jgi:hypothetical protein
MKTMFIDQDSSIDGVCMVYGFNPFVHHSNCLYNPINNKEENNTIKREREKQLSKEIEESVQTAIEREKSSVNREK